MDSDDDFGDFTFVPADALHASLPPTPLDCISIASELDAGTSFNKFDFHSFSTTHLSAIVGTSVESHSSSSIKPTQNNSDDDWGDFVEHSASTIWDKSRSLDWFATTQHSAGQPSEALTSGNVYNSLLSASDRKDGFWTDLLKVEAQHAEQKAGNFGFDGLDFSAGTGTSNLKGSKAALSQVHNAVGSNNEIATQPPSERRISGHKMETHEGSILKEINSSPMPLSLFGDTEFETENPKTELMDPATKLFQGYTRNKAVSTSLSGRKDLSNLIASLYTEAQPMADTRNCLNMNTVVFNEIENNMHKLGKEEDLDNSFYGYQSSIAGGSCNLEKSIFSLNLGLENVLETSSPKGDICINAGAELQSQEASTSLLLDSISMADQCAFVEAWASILAVCASELELALDIWKQAEAADVHLALLADLQGKKYFAAIGQIYVASLILAATSNVYKPWVQVAKKEGESLQADLERCKAVWLETNLKEGVHLALNGLEGLLPSSAVSWKGIERFATVALEAYRQAARTSVDSICKISLLPMAPFSYTGLHSVEWSGSSYLLPLANLWANCVSQKPPSTCLSA